MTRLLDDLLDVARLTRGTFVLRKEPVWLCEVLSRAQDAMQPELAASDHRLEVSLPTEPLTVDGDLVRLTQVVSNLLDNAAKYSEPGMAIWLSLHREGQEGVIRVRDAGTGIAPDLLPHVFGVFVQAEQGLDRKTGGLGVGLPLVRGIVDLHGGQIEATSEGPGRGSTFIVRLPLRSSVRDEVHSPTQSSAAGNQRHVLVVDDDPDVAESFAILLEALGISAQVVHDGPAALEAVPRLQPDVIFLDIGLPGMDGYEVAQRLREQAAGRAARLVAVTGYGQDEDRNRAKNAGFDRHLLKPVALEAIQDALQF
jgi:CheY-like chemotaxis protein